MIIRHNISALKTQRQINEKNHNLSKSMEKLSTGQRINHAADEAAGLAISEKMRAQIRGLEQAAKNSEDAISYIQTGEGALQESHNILQRMRELTVQAASDTNSKEDREKIQLEMNQLTSEINKIGAHTQYNTQNILKGTDAKIVNEIDYGTTTLENLAIADIDSVLETGRYEIQVDERKYIEPSFTGNSNVKPGGIGIDSKAELETGQYRVAVNFDYVEDANVTTSPTGITSLLYDGHKDENLITNGYEVKVIYNEVVSKDTNGNPVMDVDGNPLYDYSYKLSVVNNNNGYPTNEIEVLSGTEIKKDAIPTDIPLTNEKVGNFTISGTLTKDNPETFDLAGLGWLTQLQTSDGSDQLSKSDGTTVTSEWIDIHNPGNNLPSISLGNDITVELATGSFNENAYANFNVIQKSTAILKDSEENEIETMPIDSGDRSVLLRKEYSFLSFDVKADVDVVDGSVFFDVYNPDEKFAVMQIGANSGQNLNVAITDMRANYLNVSSNDTGMNTIGNGLTAYFTETANVEFRKDLDWSEYALDVSSQEKANANIQVIDEAINQVSSERSRLGSYQNRLDHTINNLNESSDNLTAAESRIRDVDMAKEMMEFTKNNIISQAAQAMMAQANQQPQAVLQLLR